MFSDPAPRVFGLPPGADFAAEVARGLRARLAGAPPLAMARVRLLVPTARMRAALTEALVDQGPGYLPRIQTLAELAEDHEEPAPDLDRILQTARLVRALLASGTGLAPPQAALGLARGLVALADEMAEEGVPAATLAGLDVADHAAHWQTAVRFLSLVAPWVDGAAEGGAGRRLRLAVEGAIAAWAQDPPADPVLVVGSTGSRRSTADLLAAVARLPQGAVILPGFDADLPLAIRQRLAQPGAADHPQARLAQVLDRLGNPPVQAWTAAPPPDPARNRLISLALRPAPATDQWRIEGADLAPDALDRVTLLTAPGPRAEALAIARALAEARAEGRSAALVTPDRALARRVTAALDRWRIVPDDSAGRPLGQSAPARMLRLIARRIAGERGAVPLMALLKHPLVHTGADRGTHLLRLRDVELWLRREGRPFPEAPDLAAFAARHPDAAVWAGWLGGWLAGLPGPETPLAQAIAALPAAALHLAAGPGANEAPELWAQAAGERVRAALDRLVAAIPALDPDTPLSDLPDLLDLALTGEVRDPVAADPLVMIWGPQEVRGRRADLVVLGGLVEGTWPAAPSPDPWLSRNLRLQAGLRLPERDTGLAAHDFQIAAAAPQVILSLPLRSADSESVPARWLNRLTNLAAGLPALAPGLQAARDRGAALIARALAAEGDLSAVPPHCATPNPRPAPAPPVATRPTELNVTEVARLIRDPYAIYARRVLGLQPLDPLGPEPDARQRGILVHRILESFVARHPPGSRVAEADFLSLARAQLERDLPWPAERLLWLARLARMAPDFLDWHAGCDGAPALVEGRGVLDLPGLRLVGRPDRIDRLADGGLRIWDYKTGTPPTAAQQKAFDKQLILLALMAQEGGFAGLAPARAVEAAFVGLGAEFKLVAAPVDPETLADHRARLIALMARYRRRDQGYVARRALQKDSERSDYDALSRLGEWRVSDRAEMVRVGDDDG
jgi:double-strand break repair protein AddB